MNLDIFTLFPEAFAWLREQRPVRKAIGHGAGLDRRDYRDWTPLKGGRVDDAPYGGGAGMVYACVGGKRGGTARDKRCHMERVTGAKLKDLGVRKKDETRSDYDDEEA